MGLFPVHGISRLHAPVAIDRVLLQSVGQCIGDSHPGVAQTPIRSPQTCVTNPCLLQPYNTHHANEPLPEVIYKVLQSHPHPPHPSPPSPDPIPRSHPRQHDPRTGDIRPRKSPIGPSELARGGRRGACCVGTVASWAGRVSGREPGLTSRGFLCLYGGLAVR